MKKVILVVSHLGANSSSLCTAIDKSKRIQWVQNNVTLEHPTDVNSITKTEHKSVMGMYLAQILYNYEISHKGVYNMCDFIYFIRNPKTFYVENVDYYIFRLRRIYEMARETKGIFLTWEDLKNEKGLKLIENNFGLTNLRFENEESTSNFSLNKKAERAYELCISRMNKLNLSRTSRLF